MNRVNNRIRTIWIFAFVFIINASGQQHKTHDTIQLKEVIIPSGFPIDTIVQKILFVLELQPLGNEPCEDLDFIVLYNNHSGLYFETCGIRNTYQIFWINHQDSIIFYSTMNYNRIKLIKDSTQLAKYLSDYGVRQRLGNGFDGIIPDIPGFYRSNKNFYYSYLFKKVDKLSKGNLEYYYRTIRKKIITNA